MPTSPLSVVLQHLLTGLGPEGDGTTDGELLARFVRSRDEDALAALVRRHASMVWGVCRRLLNHHDAEDAFQATFLVLVRKAAAVPRQAIANWLYGVARQTVVRVRATAAKRRRRETQVVNLPEPTVAEGCNADLPAVVDEELSRLPGHYRGVVVLCDLEGMTRKAAARQLGIPEGSVASRLARARALLAKRLNQRGVVFSGSVGAVLSAGVAVASAPPALVASTINAASLLAAGQAATGAIPVKVAALTEGVMKAMLFTKLKAASAVVLILGFVATGATLLTYRAAGGQEDPRPATAQSVALATEQKRNTKPLEQPDIRDLGISDLLQFETFTAWSQRYPGGVQVGLGFRPGEKRAYHIGETVTLVVRVRNIGKKQMLFWYHRQPAEKMPPMITDAEGKTLLLPLKDQEVEENGVGEVALAPGAQTDLYYIRMKLSPASERSNKGYMTLYGTGRVQIQETGLKGESSLGEFGNGLQLSPMLCGKVELEVNDPMPATKKPVDSPAKPQKPNKLATAEPATMVSSSYWTQGLNFSLQFSF
jgi:RNA polymerase sigma factor (sigma-70 family)